MTYNGRTGRISVVILLTVSMAAITVLFVPPAAAQPEITPADYEYDGSDLLIEGSVTATDGTVLLTLDETAAETDTIHVELGDGHSGFEIAAVTDETTTDVGISLEATAETITIQLTDPGADGTYDGAEIRVGVDLTATDGIAGRAHEYDSTPIATVTADDTGGTLVGQAALRVTVDPSAEIGFDADTINEMISQGYAPVWEYDFFVIDFSHESVTVVSNDKINISVDPGAVHPGDEGGIGIYDVWTEGILGKNITGVEVAASSSANVLNGSNDQITITIRTANDEPKLVSNEAIVVGVQLSVRTEPMWRAADRYRNVDLLTVDVEGEDNAELTDNSDVRTETPVVLDIYPGEPNAEGFDLGVDNGAEFGIGEGRSLSVDGLEDGYGNEIPRAAFEFVVDGHTGRHVHSGIWTETDGTGGPDLDGTGVLDVSLGVFDLSATVTDVPGPAEPTGTTDADRTETATGITVYPDDVRVDTTAGYRDFDVGANATIEIAVDLGVESDDVGQVDVELRRESGNGTVTFDPGSGSPTSTDLWEETGYGGDDRLGRENPWAIERDLTAADFDGGVRRYVLDADTAARYEIAATVMPYGASLDPDPSAVETSLADDPGDVNRGSVGITATGPIDGITNVSVRGDDEFVGIETDEGGAVEIDIGGFEDVNGNTVTNTDEAVAVRFGGANAGTASPIAGDGSTVVTADPTAIDAGSVETGTDTEVAIELAGGIQRNETGLTLLHRVIERPGGTWRSGSLPLPASVYVDADGDRDVVQWNPERESYEGVAADVAGDTIGVGRIGHEDLHRGFYAYSSDGGLRIGFDYVTTAEGAIGTDGIDLAPGWHLASSNYDISSHSRRDLAADVNWATYGFGDGDDAFAVWNAGRTGRLHDDTPGIDVDGASESVGHDEAYWIEIDDGDQAPLVRRIVSPTFSENSGTDE